MFEVVTMETVMPASSSVQTIESSRWQRLRLWLRPPRQLRTTSLGKIVIVFSIVIGVAATNTGNNLLYLVLGGLFGVIAASGVLSERVLRDIQVEVGTPPIGTAGRPLAVPVTLHAGRERDSFLLEVTLLDAEGNEVGRGAVRELLRGRRRSIAVPVVRPVRGALSIEQIRVATRFPFQMYEKARLYPARRTAWFAPAPTAVASGWQLDRSLHGQETNRRGGSPGEDFRGLRPRLPTDPVSRVHWKRSVAAGEQVVKIFAGAQAATVTIWIGRGVDAEQFEAGLSEVAGLIERLVHVGRPVVLRAGALRASGGAQHPDGGAACRHLLARVDRDQLADGPVWRIEPGGRA
ncbi:MAG: DUF58 domain-containing protein [Candidatus Dadabacteria bacterium]|nr:MAG: DUF58 domain-containing protein [Candidatus Dadabacteria bacterium]